MAGLNRQRLGLKGQIGLQNLDLLRKQTEADELLKLERSVDPVTLRKLIKADERVRAKFADMERRFLGFHRLDRRR